jgi:signal transduction histidine kinase
MSDELVETLSPALQLELELLRDQRDLYRSLLLAEPEALGTFMRIALKTVEAMRMSLRTPTRDHAAFRRKIERLRADLGSLGDAMIGLHLPTLSTRLAGAQAALLEVEGRASATGNDLLPTMVVLEELCSHLTIAVDCAAVHVPLDHETQSSSEPEPARAQSGPPPEQDAIQLKLTGALEQLAEKAAAEHGKRVGLVTMGLEDIPDEWSGTLFDLLGQLVRNAVEHGIEPGQQRVERGKPPIGTLVIEFVAHGSDGYELNVQDDGGGLDAERIVAAAIKIGLVASDAAQALAPARLISFMFQPGLSTVADSGRHGLGMSIVRDHVQRLGGKLQFATKRGRYTRYRIVLPALASDRRGHQPSGERGAE